MAAPYLYEIYDTEIKDWLPGQFRKKEVQIKLGITGSISEFAKTGRLLRKRYRVAIVEEGEEQPGTFMADWDETRMEILNLLKKRQRVPRQKK